MNPKFIPLTRHEMFFGITPKTILSTGGVVKSPELISKVASTPINVSYVSPTPNTSINTDVIAQQQVGFVFQDFLWKYRWEIGIGAVLAATIWYVYSVNQSEERKRNAQTVFLNQY